MSAHIDDNVPPRAISKRIWELLMRNIVHENTPISIYSTRFRTEDLYKKLRLPEKQDGA